MDRIEILKFPDRNGFRQWLMDHHATETVCWVVLKKGKPQDDGQLYYLDAVEEALCFGWIDSTQKTWEGQTLQRFSPRKKGSPWSELNKERCRRLERLGLMTDAGRRMLPDMSDNGMKIDEEIIDAFKANPVAWNHFISFPPLYQRVRIDTIQRDKHKNLELFNKRLARLIEASAKGEMFGEWNDSGRLIHP